MSDDWNKLKHLVDLSAENARLKAELDGYAKVVSTAHSDLFSENARLKAEVERLDTLCKQLMTQHSDISCENIMLRKAGDAMASSIQFNEEMAKDYNGPTIVHQCVQRWTAAKEGKPSV